MRKTDHAFKDSHQGHCGFESEIGFRLHVGQSYVLGRCLPGHQGTIISIDRAQADSLKTSGGVLLLPSMATLHEGSEAASFRDAYTATQRCHAEDVVTCQAHVYTALFSHTMDPWN